MKETLELIINTLVDEKSSVMINEINGEKSIVYEVKVAKEDMGKIKALASKKGKRVSVEFIEN